jgi:putative PIN family toxin of toxin-antitoxin system
MGALRPDVVFDCNVFLQAIVRSAGPAAHALRLVEQGAVALHVSKPILRELRLTLAYPEIRQRNPQVTDELVDRFITRLLFRGQLHRNVPHVFSFPRDPKDEPYIDLASAVRADYLVTRDKDLLSLATDHSIGAKQFRQRLPGIKIMNPVDFIAAVAQTP